jgi:catechol 2,3-dioxygenase-like lactoylglutathione lyase family enzyme
VNIKEVVPFLSVKDMQVSIAFYVDGLGFTIEDRWVDDGVMRWCRLQIGGAGLMLQQFRTEGHDARQFSDNKGEGVSLYFFCDDAIALYRAWTSKRLDASEPQVSNGMWVTSLTDPDGYVLFFQSSADAPEETKLSEEAALVAGP